MAYLQNAILLGIIILITGCADHPNKVRILGKWEVIDWTITSTGDQVSQRMLFTFEENDRYKVDYGTEVEEGYFRVDDEWLFTKEDDRAEKSVRIITFTSDTLVLEMNRAGRLEELVLARQ